MTYRPTIEQAITAVRAGRPILLTDSPTRENEADCVIAAEFATPENVNTVITLARGVPCVALSSQQADAFGLPVFATQFTNRFSPAFTLSVDLREGNTTGISAQDRSRTIQALANPQRTLNEFVIPGHVFPIRASSDGVFVRQGHTEASVDLMKIAGLVPAAMICEVLGPDGSALRGESLRAFATQQGWPLLSIEEIVDYRLRTEMIVKVEASAYLPTAFGDFEALVYSMPGQERPVVALVKRGERVHWNHRVLVRLNSECFTGDVLGSLRCDCGAQLMAALERITQEGEGVLLYLPQEGRGIGLSEKIRAYALQERGLDTVDANLHLGHPIDGRTYGFAAQVLKELGIRSVTMLTNNPSKIEGIERYGIKVVDRQAIEITPSTYNQRYLNTKRERLGHRLHTVLETVEAHR